MTYSAQGRQKLRSRLRVALAAIVFLVLALVVPPFISVHRYEGQITRLIAQSLGRPVRLSSVQVRLLPWPGFELNDLSVAEDPAYGAEPVLHAETVTASIRLLALLRGRIEIGTISVDNASLNLVRAAAGRWNLDPLFRTAAAQAGSGSSRSARLPTLKATGSRINFKNGVEKLPFSLIDADLTVWEESPGQWRIRLRGQPARTDVSLYQEDTGVVRLEATVRRAPALRQMPLHLDLDWREAQLGQLTRLVAGSDPGWRGDLTGELHVDGTADAAQIAMRLRAAGVHRAEFVPAAPLDFDANCNFVYHYTRRSLENLACDSPLGDGRVKIAGDKLGTDAPPHFTLELDRVPVAAGLDALRTLRNGVQPDLEASGTVSGKIVYSADAGANAQPAPAKTLHSHASRTSPIPQGPLSGTLAVENLALSGGGLTQPLRVPRMTLQPVSTGLAQPGAAPVDMGQGLAGTATIPAGGPAPLVLNLHLALTGYQAALRGQASYPRALELARAAGLPGTDVLSALAGDPIAIDITAAGPWMPPGEIPVNTPPAAPSNAGAAQPPISATGLPTADTLAGTVTIRNANWKADYLANHVEISEAVLHLGQGGLRWDPVVFTYGPVKGTATITLPAACQPDVVQQPCAVQPAPTFNVQFGALDVSTLQTALLGAREKGTLLSSLIDRLHPASAPPWPRVQGSVTADSLVLDPVTLGKVSAVVELSPTEADITSLDAVLFGGRVHATGSLNRPENDRDKPDYQLEGDFQNLNAAALGKLLNLRWTGGEVSGNGKIELSGYTGADFASSAKGALHIESRHGSIVALGSTSETGSSKANKVPASLARFDRFTTDATIANGAIQLSQSQAVSGSHKQSVDATVTFGDPPVVSFAAPKTPQTEKH